MQRTSRLDLWAWVAVAIGLLAIRMFPTFTPEIGHDSFQYLSSAENALAGRFGYTSLIHYDVERMFGVLPAPMMTFPYGYPLAIALVSLTGLSTLTAAWLLSAASTIACIPLLFRVGRQIGLSRALCNVIVACFVLNGMVTEYGTAALTEGLFMLLALSGVAALVTARQHKDGGGVRYWILAGLAFGACYFVRYVGLFVILGLGLVVVRYVLTRERLLAKGHAIALGVASLFVTAGITRNMLLVGNWRGRDEMTVNHPLMEVLLQTGQAINGLFLGVGTGKSALGGTFGLKVTLLALLAAGIVSLAWRRWRQRSTETAPQPVLKSTGIDLFLMVMTYMACMVYAGHASSISYGAARHFLPVVPLFLLLFGVVLRFLLPDSDNNPSARRLPLAAFAISFCCYAYLNLLVIHKPLDNQAAVVAKQFEAAGHDAQVSRAAVLSVIGPTGAILANNGQAMGHFLGRPTISTVSPMFSSVVWDEQTVHETIQRFDLAAVVITAPVPGRPNDEDIPSPFIDQLAQGSAPAWLKLVNRTGAVLTYVPVPTVSE